MMNSENDNYFQSKALMEPPAGRAAFSDRRAWLMAELSRLAYFPFEGGNFDDRYLERIKEVVNDREQYESVVAIVSKVLGGDPVLRTSAEAAFEDILSVHDFSLVGIFAEHETQGFVAKREKSAYLIYRGTESLGDIKNDVQGKLIPVELNGIRAHVHMGFWQQFKDAHEKVEELLAKVSDCQLHIGGHSLGGALANLATKFYSNDSSGSTYTFGAPAVSPPSFQDSIKTPIYRVVNARDPVPLLPNPALMHAMGVLWYWLARLLGFVGSEKQKEVSRMLKEMAKMDQIGYPSRIVYVGTEPKLRYSFGMFQRIKLWTEKPWSSFSLNKHFLNHHKISNYVYALRRWGESRVSN